MNPARSCERITRLPRTPLDDTSSARSAASGARDDRRDELDQVLHRHRVEEVQTEHVLGALGRHRELHDRDRRRVRRQDRVVVLDDLVEAARTPRASRPPTRCTASNTSWRSANSPRSVVKRDPREHARRAAVVVELARAHRAIERRLDASGGPPSIAFVVHVARRALGIPSGRTLPRSPRPSARPRRPRPARCPRSTFWSEPCSSARRPSLKQLGRRSVGIRRSRRRPGSRRRRSAGPLQTSSARAGEPLEDQSAQFVRYAQFAALSELAGRREVRPVLAIARASSSIAAALGGDRLEHGRATSGRCPAELEHALQVADRRRRARHGRPCSRRTRHRPRADRPCRPGRRRPNRGSRRRPWCRPRPRSRPPPGRRPTVSTTTQSKPAASSTRTACGVALRQPTEVAARRHRPHEDAGVGARGSACGRGHRGSRRR